MFPVNLPPVIRVASCCVKCLLAFSPSLYHERLVLEDKIRTTNVLLALGIKSDHGASPVLAQTTRYILQSSLSCVYVSCMSRVRWEVDERSTMNRLSDRAGRLLSPHRVDHHPMSIAGSRAAALIGAGTGDSLGVSYLSCLCTVLLLGLK
jgi:hypothetical protein